MDPWYRTIYGFQSLIEKEWIKFGHKFSQRLGQSKTDSKKPEKAPYFLQFIDCVWQMTMSFFLSFFFFFLKKKNFKFFFSFRQYPTDFEFNEKYLKDILIEVYAGRFGNFLFNSEYDRMNNPEFKKTVTFFLSFFGFNLN